MSFPNPTHAFPIVKCVDGKVLVPFPNASHPIPRCLPVPFPTTFPYCSWYASLILPIGGEAPYPSHTRFPSSSQTRPKAFPSRARWEVLGSGLGRLFFHSDTHLHGALQNYARYSKKAQWLELEPLPHPLGKLGFAKELSTSQKLF